ncbi:hypothetical protein IRJ41_001436 [Triplophysa rosa]|uniref:Uncharacterized protein n=1 Tax=Triplophysa rosa TaxID=992332 RepID=A0A9W7T6N1_TRIRA|nr:hypothetical protein IRJ41_001436 [Triplophysa rosa]
MDGILGHRPIVTSLASVINSSVVNGEDIDNDFENTQSNADSEESPDISDSVGLGADGDRSSPNESQLDSSIPSVHQRFWTRSSARSTSRRGELTPFFDARLRQQQEQADRDKETIQSISTVLTQAVQCFERCAEAAEKQARACEAMACSGQQGRNIVQGHLHTSTFPTHEQSTSYNQQPSTSYNRPWSTSNSPTDVHHTTPYKQNSTTPTDMHDTNASFTSYFNLH